MTDILKWPRDFTQSESVEPACLSPVVYEMFPPEVSVGITEQEASGGNFMSAADWQRKNKVVEVNQSHDQFTTLR